MPRALHPLKGCHAVRSPDWRFILRDGRGLIAAVRALGMLEQAMGGLRAILASYWTAGFALAAMTALHARWLARWLARSPHAGDVLSAYGAGLVALGVLVGSRPYLRAGFAQLVETGLPQYDGMTFSTDERWRAHQSLVAKELPKVRRDVLAERIGAVALVIIGTLLSGWAAPLARRWGLPV